MLLDHSKSSPIKIMDSVAAVAVSYERTVAIKTDGSLWTWGTSHLGDGTSEPSLSQVRIMDGMMLPGGAVASIPTPTSTSSVSVTPTPSKVFVNSAEQSFEAYNIDGNNYFKLRDLAYVLNGTEKQFAVGYDDATKAVTIITGQLYTVAGREMTAGDGQSKAANPTPSKITIDGEELNFTVYNIGGNNFFKLRDIMSALDVAVTYDEMTRNIGVDTSQGYTPE